MLLLLLMLPKGLAPIRSLLVPEDAGILVLHFGSTLSNSGLSHKRPPLGLIIIQEGKPAVLWATVVFVAARLANELVTHLGSLHGQRFDTSSWMLHRSTSPPPMRFPGVLQCVHFGH